MIIMKLYSPYLLIVICNEQLVPLISQSNEYYIIQITSYTLLTVPSSLVVSASANCNLFLYSLTNLVLSPNNDNKYNISRSLKY